MSDVHIRVAQYDELLRRFASGVRAAQLYASDHPLIGRNVEGLLAVLKQLHTLQASITVGIVGSHFVVSDTPMSKASVGMSELIKRLRDNTIERISFGERQLLRFARSQSTDPVPGATVCYVWDLQLPAGTDLDNAFTRRMRYVVVRSGSDKLNQWVSERRDVTADFLRLFKGEAETVPKIIGVAIGADSDNTKSHSVG